MTTPPPTSTDPDAATSPAAGSAAGDDDAAFRTALSAAVATDGRSLAEHGRPGPALVLFVRHLGCTFCREAAADLAAERSGIEARGAAIVIVHPATEEQARPFFARYGLDDIPRVADPDAELYRAFELRRGTLGQLFGPTVWWRGAVALVRGHGVGRLQGDGFQMPGAFVLRDGRIVAAYRHTTAADRPSCAALVDQAL